MKINSFFPDIVFFAIWPIIAAIVSIYFPVNALSSSLIFFGVPSIYLSVKKPQLMGKGFTFSFFSIPIMIIVDYIAETTHTWNWPLPSSVLPKIFNVVSAEVLVWAFLNFYIVILFYEYFFDRHKTYKNWSKRSVEFLFVTILLFTVFLVLFLFAPDVLKIPFWYLVFGFIFLITPILFQIRLFPIVFLKILKASSYFVYINLVYELTAVTLNWWSFDGGQFIGWISLGNLRFPIEEFVFWIVLFAVSLLSYYERFFDDER